MTKRYVELHKISVDGFTPEIEILERKKELSNHIDDDVFAIMFYDRREVIEGDELLIGKEFNYSDYYYVGERITADEFKKSHTIHQSTYDWTKAVTFGYNGFIRVGSKLPQLICVYGSMKNKIVPVKSIKEILKVRCE